MCYTTGRYSKYPCGNAINYRHLLYKFICILWNLYFWRKQLLIFCLSLAVQCLKLKNKILSEYTFLICWCRTVFCCNLKRYLIVRTWCNAQNGVKNHPIHQHHINISKFWPDFVCHLARILSVICFQHLQTHMKDWFVTHTPDWMRSFLQAHPKYAVLFWIISIWKFCKMMCYSIVGNCILKEFILCYWRFN